VAIGGSFVVQSSLEDKYFEILDGWVQRGCSDTVGGVMLRAMMFEQEATRRVLVRKGLLTSEEVLEEIKAVRREMEGKRGLWR
jgi:hypothetical protein